MPEEATDHTHYTKPEISDHGELADLTAGHKTGASLDASFPVGTPFTQLTFSTP